MINTLANKSLAFSKKIGEQWKDTEGNDSESFRRRFLYSSTFGASHTANSYWILHQNGCFNDCGILARNLLERIFNSGFALQSSTHAVKLIAGELSDKIRRANLLKAQLSSPFPELDSSLNEHQKHLEIFIGLLQTGEAPGPLSYIIRAKEAGLLSYYRSAYFNLSRYAHAGYEMAQPKTHNLQDNATDYIALIAPIYTAVHCHRVDCPKCTLDACKIHREYAELVREFSSHTLGS